MAKNLCFNKLGLQITKDWLACQKCVATIPHHLECPTLNHGERIMLVEPFVPKLPNRVAFYLT